MSGDGFFLQAFVYLAAAVVSVPIAKRLGLGSVLGYLIAGILIGPFVFGWIGEEGEDILHFAEFGVVMMLFVIGLELEPSLLWRLRTSILGLGGLQVVLTTAAVMVICLLLGFAWQPALAIGMILALSSTAMVLQTLNEKGLMPTQAGQGSFSVLLFQDIAVIPMLAIFPLLVIAGHGDAAHGADDGHAATTLVAGLPAWGQTLAVLGAVVAVILIGRYLGRPVFRIVAQTRMRELFTATALFLVIGIALLMTYVGLSPALGTFLAGVVLANSEYRHELESDIEPFKGLLLGLFFIAVGASIDFQLIAQQPMQIVLMLLGIVALKFAILFGLGRAFSMSLDQTLLFAFCLAQVGEFAFVLLSSASQLGVLEASVTSPLTAVVALSMAITPLLLTLNERFIQPRVGTRESDGRPADEIEESNPVIIVGFGKFGTVVGRFLRANGIGTTILDIDSDQVDSLRRLDIKVYYGDATRHDLLASAGAEEAKLIIIAIDSPDKTIQLVHTVRKHFPNLKIFARAKSRSDAHNLINEGVEHVYRESLDTSLRMGTDVLHEMGFRAYQAQRAAQTFRDYDEESLIEMASLSDQQEFLAVARRRIIGLEELMQSDLQEAEEVRRERDAAWDTSTLRADVMSNTR